MTDKQIRIDQFLKFFRDISVQNPQLQLNYKMVYEKLTKIGTTEFDNNTKINNNFDDWINHFSNDNNIDVFNNEEHKYFCQFISSDRRACRAVEHLKLYIPLDSTHINQGAKEIFEFLSKENISHQSKIGSDVRFDDIVVRLVDRNDAIKLINFVTCNAYIKEGLMKPNPFILDANGVSLACDGELSFNSTIARLISLYINSNKKTNTLYQVGTGDFYAFVHQYYGNAFMSPAGVSKLVSDFELGTLRKDDLNKILVNYQNVFELILKNFNPEFSINNYFSHFEECRNTELQTSKLKYVKQLTDLQLDDETINQTNKMAIYIINTMCEKYRNKEVVIDSIQRYLETNDASNITRYKGLRDEVVNSDFRHNMEAILKANKTYFNDYITNLLAQKEKDENTEIIGQEKALDFNQKSIILTTQEIINVMTNKYNINVAYTNLSLYIQTGEPEKLTRQDDLRERVVNSNYRTQVIQLLNEQNLTFSDFIQIVNNTVINKAEFHLEKAILETHKKYDTKYKMGESQYSGKEWVSASVAQLIAHGDYTGFTRDNHVRDELIKNISKEECFNLIKEKLQINGQQLNSEDIKNIAAQYINMTLKNNHILQ